MWTAAPRAMIFFASFRLTFLEFPSSGPATDGIHGAGGGLSGRAGNRILEEIEAELAQHLKLGRRFEPGMDVGRREELYEGWRDAIERTKSGRKI